MHAQQYDEYAASAFVTALSRRTRVLTEDQKVQLGRFCDRTQHLLSRMKPWALVSVLYGLSKIRVRPSRAYLVAWRDACLAKFYSRGFAEPQAFSNIMYALGEPGFGGVEVLGKEFFLQWSVAFTPLLGTCASQHLANSISGLAKQGQGAMDALCETFVRDWSHAVVSHLQAHSYPLVSVWMTLLALEQLHLDSAKTHPLLFPLLAQSCSDNVSLMQSSELATTLYRLSRMEELRAFMPAEFYHAWLSACQAKARGSFKDHELRTIAESLVLLKSAGVKQVDSTFSSRWEDVARMHGGGGGGGVINHGDTHQSVASRERASSHALKMKSIVSLETLITYAEGTASEFNNVEARAFVTFASKFSSIAPPSIPQASRLRNILTYLPLHQYEALTLAVIIAKLAKFPLVPDSAWLQKWVAAARATMGSMSSKDMSTVLYALATLNLGPTACGDLFYQELIQRTALIMASQFSGADVAVTSVAIASLTQGADRLTPVTLSTSLFWDAWRLCCVRTLNEATVAALSGDDGASKERIFVLSATVRGMKNFLHFDANVVSRELAGSWWRLCTQMLPQMSAPDLLGLVRVALRIPIVQTEIPSDFRTKWLDACRRIATKTGLSSADSALIVSLSKQMPSFESDEGDLPDSLPTAGRGLSSPPLSTWPDLLVYARQHSSHWSVSEFVEFLSRANVLRGSGRISSVVHEDVESIYESLVPVLDSLSSESSASIIHGISKLGVRPSASFTNAWARSCCELFPSMSAMQLATVVHSVWKLQLESSLEDSLGWYMAWGDACARHDLEGSFSSQELSMITRSLARVPILSEFFERAWERECSRALGAEAIDPHSVTLLGLGLATMVSSGIPGNARAKSAERLLAAWLEACSRHLSGRIMGPRDLVDVLQTVSNLPLPLISSLSSSFWTFWMESAMKVAPSFTQSDRKNISRIVKIPAICAGWTRTTQELWTQLSAMFPAPLGESDSIFHQIRALKTFDEALEFGASNANAFQPPSLIIFLSHAVSLHESSGGGASLSARQRSLLTHVCEHVEHIVPSLKPKGLVTLLSDLQQLGAFKTRPSFSLTWQKAMRLSFENLDVQDLTVVLRAIPTLDQAPPDGAFWNDWSKEYMRKLGGTVTERSLSNTVNLLYKLHVGRDVLGDHFFVQWSERCIKMFPHKRFLPEQLSMMAVALQGLRADQGLSAHVGHLFWSSFLEAFSASVDRMKPYDLGATMWALVKMDQVRSMVAQSLVVRWLQACVDKRDLFKAEMRLAVQNSVSTLQERISGEALRLWHEFLSAPTTTSSKETEAVSSRRSSHSMAMRRLPLPNLLEYVGTNAQETSFTPSDVSSFFGSVVLQSEAPHPDLTESQRDRVVQVCQHATPMLGAMKARSLATIIHALSKLRVVPPPQFFSAWRIACEASMNDFELIGLRNVISSLGQLGYKSEQLGLPFLSGWRDAFRAQLRMQEDNHARGPSNLIYSLDGIVSVVGAREIMGQDFFFEVSRVTVKFMSEFKAPYLIKAFVLFQERLKISESALVPSFWRVWRSRCIELMMTMKPADLVVVFRAMAATPALRDEEFFHLWHNVARSATFTIGERAELEGAAGFVSQFQAPSQEAWKAFIQ